jgi:hypothetical protein
MEYARQTEASMLEKRKHAIEQKLGTNIKVSRKGQGDETYHQLISNTVFVCIIFKIRKSGRIYELLTQC